MTKTVDARGLACPQPVILSRNALMETDAITTIVDNESARLNVSRMAEREGCLVSVDERSDGIYLSIRRDGGKPAALELPVSNPSSGNTGPLVLVVQQDIMGRGDEVLGGILVRGFFHTLGEVNPQPDTIIFYNTGVKLAVEGSPVLEDLKQLAQRGIEILSCGTCLGHFDLSDQLAVGEISNMYDIAEKLLGAGRVINL